MNDLIRREDVLALFPINDCSDKMVGLYERVLDIPTAYDISKVVAELEECSDKYKSSSCEYEQGKAFSYKNAIDIVKRGGIDG